MPSEAYELVRRTVTRFQEGDRVYWRSVVAEDVVWDMTRDEAGLLGEFHGHEGVEDFFVQWLGTWDDYSLVHTEILDAGDSVVVVFRQHGRGRGSGVEVDREFYGVYDVRDGKIARYTQYASRAEALEAAGLSPGRGRHELDSVAARRSDDRPGHAPVLRSLLDLVSGLAEARESLRVVGDDHRDVARRRRHRVVPPEEVDLCAVPLQPGGPLAEALWRVDVLEAEQPPEGRGRLAVALHRLQRDVLNQRADLVWNITSKGGTGGATRESGEVSMSRTARALLCAFGLALLVFSAAATADPGEDHADEIVVPPPTLPNAGPGSKNAELLDAADKDGTINSDIAFRGIWPTSATTTASGSSTSRTRRTCRCSATPSVARTRETCRSSTAATVVSTCSSRSTGPLRLRTARRLTRRPRPRPTSLACRGRARFGYEGLRLIDVTDPRNPQYEAFFRTECGSHTHTIVSGGKTVHAYVASYPLLSQITPEVDREAAGDLFCDAPHSKISVVSMPLDNPAAGTVRTEPLSGDTEFYDQDGPTVRHEHDGNVEYHGTAPPFQSCHDHQAFLARNIMVASCAGDLQYWDISNRGNPTADVEGRHTHIQREVPEDDPDTPDNERLESFDFIHNATVTWDGKLVAAVDEAGGGVAARCDGPNTKRGFTFFYPLVTPGTAVDGFSDLRGRYVIPRPQGSDICVSHNGNVLPTSDGRYRQVQAFYQAGNTLVDFTNPASPTELAFADLEDELGGADSWSTYWYNDVMYVNGGLGRRGATGNRGFEAYALYDDSGQRIRTRKWHTLNPQTQEAWQAP